MPPIPLHKDSPIKPTTADNPTGINPQTQPPDAPSPTRTMPFSYPATTTSAASNSPPPPQPGARPAAPTSSFNPSTYNDGTLPPPQPGAASSGSESGSRGYTATHTTTETRFAGPPPQMSIPPPMESHLAARSTTTSPPAPAHQYPSPTTLNLGAVQSPYQQQHEGGAVAAPTSVSQAQGGVEHPPGYVQAAYSVPQAGGNDTGGGGADGGIVATVGSYLSMAGEALKKGEEAAWRAVRDK